MYCDVSLTSLTSAPFNLIQGSQVVARVRSFNTLGYSPYSNPSSNLVYIVALPHKPSLAPQRNEVGSTKTSIQVDMPVIIGPSTGGLSILSYMLEWN